MSLAAATETALTAAWEAARAAWPAIALDRDVFARNLGRCLANGEPLETLRLPDLYLACACAENLPAAHAALEATILVRVPAFLSGLQPSDELIETTRQALREKLLLGTSRTPPKIGQYGGKGSLEGWIRVAAVRTALNLLAERKDPGSAGAGDADIVERALPAGTNLELDYLKARYREAVARAFSESLAALEQGDRVLLRFHFVDGLPPGRIGELYGVHRTTIMRRLDAAVGALLSGMRTRVSERLGLGKAETESLFQLVRSQLDVTLGGLLRAAPEAE